MWNARMGALEKSVSRMVVALLRMSFVSSLFEVAPTGGGCVEKRTCTVGIRASGWILKR